MKNKKILGLATVFLLLSIFTLLSVSSLLKESPTWDEPFTFSSGLYYLHTADFRMQPGHPPLTYYISALPLYFYGIELPANASAYVDYSNVAFGEELLRINADKLPEMVFLGRIPFVFIAIILGILVFRWAKELYGVHSGLLALFLYSLNPVILSQSYSNLTDLPVAFFIFLNLYFLWKFFLNQKKLYLILTGITFGLAVASKMSGLYLIPIYLLIGAALILTNQPIPNFNLIRKFAGKKEFLQRSFRYASIIAVIFLIGGLMLLPIYQFQFTTLEKAAPARHTTFINEYAESLPLGSTIKNLITTVPLPIPTFFVGLAQSAVISSVLHKNSYLAGEVYQGGKWQYFFVEFFLKNPLSLFLFFGIALFVFFKSEKRFVNELFIIIPALTYFALFLPNSENVGIRHLLPIFPFFFVFVSRIASFRLKKKNVSMIFFATIAVLMLPYAYSSVSIHPHYFSYFNALVGPENGYKYLVGGNLDQGQDLKGLRDYLSRNNITRVNLSYFGSIDPELYGIEYEYMPSPMWQPWDPNFSPKANYSDIPIDCRPKKGIIAISVTNLQGVHLNNQNCYSWLKTETPIEKIGYSIFIYELK